MCTRYRADIYVATIVEGTFNTWINEKTLLTSGDNKMESNLDLNSYKIINLAEPDIATDAATKNYVDNLGVANKLNLAGGTIDRKSVV